MLGEVSAQTAVSTALIQDSWLQRDTTMLALHTRHCLLIILRAVYVL